MEIRRRHERESTREQEARVEALDRLRAVGRRHREARQEAADLTMKAVFPLVHGFSNYVWDDQLKELNQVSRWVACAVIPSILERIGDAYVKRLADVEEKKTDVAGMALLGRALGAGREDRRMGVVWEPANDIDTDRRWISREGRTARKRKATRMGEAFAATKLLELLAWNESASESEEEAVPEENVPPRVNKRKCTMEGHVNWGMMNGRFIREGQVGWSTSITRRRLM